MNMLKHLFKWKKNFLLKPIQTTKVFFDDYKRQNNREFEIKHNFLWCIGLPKSGTTFIEEIFESLNYLNLANSPLRICRDIKFITSHQVSHEIFKDIDVKKRTYLKTHTHFFPEFENYASLYDVKIIFSFRKLEDMMISRYFHIISDKRNRFHQKIKNLDYHEGFKLSLVLKSKNEKITPLHYFYNWILNWKIYLENNRNYLLMNYEELNLSKLNYIKKILNYLEIDKKYHNSIINKINTKNKNNYRLDTQLSLIKPKTLNLFKPITKENLLNPEVENFYKKEIDRIKNENKKK